MRLRANASASRDPWAVCGFASSRLHLCPALRYVSNRARCGPGAATDLNRVMTMCDVEARRSGLLRVEPRSCITRGAVAAAVASAIAIGIPSFALGQNYCLGHSTADGCNIRASGPHISAAGISHGRLHLTLTFHKAGRFVAHLKRNPPPEPYDRDWGPRPTFGKAIPVGLHPAGPGTVTIALGTLAPGRYGVIVLPTNPVRGQPGQPLDRRTVPSWVYFTERAGHAVDLRVLQP